MAMELSEKCVFVWKINNYLSFVKVPGDVIDSPIFKPKQFDGSQWYMKIYPRGDGIQNFEFVSIYLCKKRQNISPETNAQIAAEIELIAGDNKSIVKSTFRGGRYEEYSMLGFDVFAPVSAVSAKMKEVDENYLTIRCRLLLNFAKISQEYTFHSDSLVDKTSFLWNLIPPNVESKAVTKEFSFSKNSLYEMVLNLAADEFDIFIRQKENNGIHSKFITCKLTLLKINGDSLISLNDEYLFEANGKSDYWKLPTFLTKTFLEANKHDLLQNNSISVQCDLTSSTVLSYCDNSVSNTDISCSILQEEMRNLFLKQIHSDIKLKTCDEVVHAHKSILAVRSPVFMAMFDQDMTESQSGSVDIIDVETSALKQFLEFVYTGKVKMSGFEETKKLLLVADKYQVLSLKEECVAFLKSNFSVDDACELLSLADMIGHEELRTISMDFICKNSSTIFNSPVWTDLIKQNVGLASKVVAHITTNYKIVPKNSSA